MGAPSRDPLPSVRALSRRLGVSINTVRTAYGRLQADGLVVMRQGARTKVAEKLRAARSSWAWTSSCDASCGIHEPVGWTTLSH